MITIEGMIALAGLSLFLAPFAADSVDRLARRLKRRQIPPAPRPAPPPLLGDNVVPIRPLSRQDRAALDAISKQIG